MLLDLYQNAYGQRQKQWMDKMQSDVLERGIKYAQWIRFSTKAQAMMEEKMAQRKRAKLSGDGGNGVDDQKEEQQPLEVRLLTLCWHCVFGRGHVR